jgi:NAD-specific glutamate dehydrogenase
MVRIVALDNNGGDFLALYPGEPYPGNSNLNLSKPAQQIGNLAIVPLGASGNFLVKNGSSLNSIGFVLDVVSYVV